MTTLKDDIMLLLISIRLSFLKGIPFLWGFIYVVGVFFNSPF